MADHSSVVRLPRTKARTRSLKAREAASSAVKDKQLTPLEYLIEIVNDKNEKRAIRLDAAKAAAPYIHPRLASTISTNGGSGSHEEWLRSMQDNAMPPKPADEDE